jgi:hypothetical protein
MLATKIIKIIMMATKMTELYLRLIRRFPWLVLLLTVILVLLAASGGRFLTFSNDYRIFFGKDNPQLQAFEALQNTYTKNDNVLFVITPKDGNVFSRETLEALEDLTHQSWQMPYSIRVDSITNFQHTYAKGDELVVEDLVKAAQGLNDVDLAAKKDIVLHEPALIHRLISPAADVTAVNVTVHLPGKNEQLEGPAVVTFARELAHQIETRYPQLEVRITGMVFMNNAFAEASQHDVQTLIPLMFLIITGLIGITLRSIAATVTTLLVIIMSIMTAMGLTGWLGIVLSPPSGSAPTIIMTMAVAHAVHIFATFSHAYALSGDKRGAIIESLRMNLQPIFITSVTTVVGFLSLNFSDAPPFRDLGNIVAIGEMAASVIAVTFLPALMMILPLRRPKATMTSRSLVEKWVGFVVARYRVVFWGMVGVVIVLASFIPKNELNDQFVKYFDESVAFRQDTDYTNDRLAGIYLIEYSLNSGKPDGISDPAYLQTVEDFANWYRQQPGVSHVNTITDTMKRLNKNLHEDDPAWYRIPDQRDLAAQYLLLYEMSLPFGLDLNNQINVDKSATRLSVTMQSLSTKEMLAMEQRGDEWLAQHANVIKHSDASSPSLMFAHIGERNIKSMLTGSVVALVLISAILLLMLRSIKIGIISLVPNLIPAAMAFGLWGIFVGEVGLALSVVVGMSLGIIVDDTVHFLSKYQHARREKGLNQEAAVRYSFSTVGMPIWITTTALVAGFLVMTLSGFEANAAMGVMTALTIALALLAEFLLLPALLLMFEEKRNAKVA